MEIIDADPRSGDDLVEIAFADTREEAALIRGLLREESIRSLAKGAGLSGPMRDSGLSTRSPRRIYVNPEDAERARTLLGEIMVEDPLEAEIPEPANAAYLADATGRRLRNYSLLGAYARFYAVAVVVVAVALAVFLLVH